MKCECEDYKQCIHCIHYDECIDKPINPYVKYTLLALFAFVLSIIVLIFK